MKQGQCNPAHWHSLQSIGVMAWHRYSPQRDFSLVLDLMYNWVTSPSLKVHLDCQGICMALLELATESIQGIPRVLPYNFPIKAFSCINPNYWNIKADKKPRKNWRFGDRVIWLFGSSTGDKGQQQPPSRMPVAVLTAAWKIHNRC